MDYGCRQPGLSADGSCITWSLADQNPFMRVNALFAANFFKSVLYHPDESQLITCGTDRKITYWDVLNMNAIRIVDGSETADVNTLSINADGKFFVSGGADKTVRQSEQCWAMCLCLCARAHTNDAWKAEQ